MSEENTEETNDNLVEEETTIEEPQEEGKPDKPTEEEAPKEKPDSPENEHTDAEKRLYARAKKAEEEAKKAKEEAKIAKEELSKTSNRTLSDVDAIIEVQQATKGLDATEVAELKYRATATGVSLSEARKNNNFVLWQTAYREKVDKEKALNPSTRQQKTEQKPTLAQQLETASLEEKEKLLTEAGLWKSPRRRDPKTIIPLSQ